MRKVLPLLLLALVTLAPAATAQDDTTHFREMARIGRSIPDPQSLQWRPDGRMLALGMADGTIRIGDVADLMERCAAAWSQGEVDLCSADCGDIG